MKKPRLLLLLVFLAALCGCSGQKTLLDGDVAVINTPATFA